jgi:CRP-like cAMP-binding protein
LSIVSKNNMATATKPTTFNQTYPVGTVLFEQNQPAQAVYILERGRVIVSRAARGYTLWLGTYGPGSLLGEVALATGQKHESTATALEEISVVTIDGQMLESMIVSSPEFAIRMIRLMAEREESYTRRIAALAERDPMARLVTYFADQVRLGVQEIAGDPQELAVNLALAQEEVEVAMARLLRARLLSPTANGTLAVPDIGQMWEFYDFYERRRRGES